MKVFITCGTHFSHPTEIRRYCATSIDADQYAAGLVNLLRSEIGGSTLPPVSPAQWRDGLIKAQRQRLETCGTPAENMSESDLATEAEFEVWIEEAEIEGLSNLAISDRELASILAALRLYQRNDCPVDLRDIATNGDTHIILSADEIDALCERINSGDQRATCPNVVVALEGGLVSGVVADQPIRLLVVDYDVEGASDDDVSLVPQDDHVPVEAIVSQWSGDGPRIDPEWIAALDAAIAEQPED